MKEFKGTRGEWIMHPKANGNVISKDEGRVVSNCMGYSTSINSDKARDENLANAKLIIAAPDLLEACILMKNNGFQTPSNKDYNKLVEAINKATSKCN